MDFDIIFREFDEFNKKLLQMQNDPSPLTLEERIIKLREDNDFSGKIFEQQDWNGKLVKYIGFKPDIKITAKCSCENKLEWSVCLATPMKSDGDGNRYYDVEYDSRFFNGSMVFEDYDSLWKAVAAMEEFTRIIRHHGGFLCVDENLIGRGCRLHGS